jgi:hypothetical protein
MKQSVITIIVWGVVQLLILLMSMLLWNWVLPSIGVQRINFLQIALLYALVKLLNFNWVKEIYESSKLKQKNNER